MSEASDLRIARMLTCSCLSLMTFGAALADNSTVASRDTQAVTEEIVVSAPRRETITQVDRTIYDVKTSSDAANLTATDVVKRLPDVIVTPSNQVIIRGGQRVHFLVDGQPVREDIALAIPASQIASVEVLTNPSAKYASSSGAIINIVLKKRTALGWKGAITGKGDTLGGYDTGINLTHGGEKWNFFGTIATHVIPERINTDRTLNYADLQNGLYDSQTTDSREHSFFRQVILQSKWVRNFSKDDDLSIILGARVNKAPSRVNYINSVSGPGFNQNDTYSKIVQFNGLYPYAILNYEAGAGDAYHLTSGLDAYAGVSSDDEETSGAITERLHDHLSFDYVHGNVDLEAKLPWSDIVSAGFSVANNDVNDNLTLTGFSGPGQTELDNFRFTRKSYAAYVTYAVKTTWIETKAGLRIERLEQDLNNSQGAIPGLRSETYVLPSLHVLEPLDDYNTLRASFTSRTQIPDALNLDPSPKYTSPYMAQRGNPFLRPASERQAELTYSFERSQLSFTQTAYYRDTKNDVNNYSVLGSGGVTILSYTNLGTSTVYGYTATIKDTLFKKLSVSYDLDVFHKRIVAPSTLDQFQNINYYGFISKAAFDYKLDEQNELTASISYTNKSYSLGVVSPENWASDIQYVHNFDKKIALTIDLVNMGVPLTGTTHFLSPGFSGFERVYRASQLVRIGLSKSF